VIPEAADVDDIAVAGFVEATTNKHMYGVTSQEGAEISANNTTSLGYALAQAGYKKTVWQYSSSSAYAVVSLLARILTTDYTANNSVITLMYKTEPSVVPETLNATQLGYLEANAGNVFVTYNNATSIIEKGTVASGDFVDTIIGADALGLGIQNGVYNLLYTSTTKVPQTDAGSNLIANAIEAVCSQFVTNGLLAPGVWGLAGFGELAQGDFLPKGFYVYAPPVANQAAADRAARKSVTFQVAAKLAGAVHTANIIVNVAR